MIAKGLKIFLCFAIAVAFFGCGPKADFENSIGIKFKLIEPGAFMMGADPAKGIALDDEIPIHEVKISRPFYISIFETTQAQWEAVTGQKAGFFEGEDRPVESVSWQQIQEFIAQLNKMEKTDAYMLPSEAQWEYSARAGGDNDLSPDELEQYAWNFKNAKGETHPVGKRSPNAWGIYDLLGNVWEFCSDWYSVDYFAHSPGIDPMGPESGDFKVYRGGSWYPDPECCRLADRDNTSPDFKSYYVGFRLIKRID